MALKASFIAFTVAATTLAVARGGAAQATDHAHDGQAQMPMAGHEHVDPVVDCTTLASPPWSGLPEADRQEIAQLHEAVAGLTTPEAAEAAGFRPALGDIPGMGVHYVNRQRTREGVHAGEPDQLLFSKVDGKEQLVGVAYSFIDVPDTDEPVPFQSDLAHWHDHPQFAPAGETLHMLHVWFVPSSNGPFAGLNFWLPFEEKGLTPPSACWMGDPKIADRVKTIAFALVSRGAPGDQAATDDRATSDDRASSDDQAAAATPEAPTSPERQALLDDLDTAARAQDLGAWTRAADRLIADFTPAERMRSRMWLRVLENAQMSSDERDAAGQPN
jgi:hypothetical protein